MIKRRKKLLHTSTSNRLHILNMNLEKSTFLLMSSSNLLIIIQSQLIISLVVEKSEITKNKECALYAAVRILSGAFFIYWENTFLIYKKISEYLANIEFVRYSEIKFDAAGRTRTGTATNRLILSQVRLPIPPQRLILSDKKIFLSESAFLCYHIRSHFSTIFYDFICFLFAKFLSNLKTIKCCKIVFRCLRTANHLYTSIFFQEQLR